MSARDFDAALAAPDVDATFQTLHHLTSRNERFSGASLPTTAEKYLKAFCDAGSSATRRRWVGVALRKMVRTSTEVVKHFKTLRHRLPQLGQVILGSTELEETRILAGVIIREAMEQGIQFSSFWPSDKVPNNAPNFPQESGPHWLHDFQTFLDTLGDLVIMQLVTDPAILYPVSLVASDNFKCLNPEDVAMTAIIQDRLLTIIPELSTQNLDFVDIPLHRIQNISQRRATLKDSQSRGTEHEPWDLVISLRRGPWTYCVNTSRHTGTELTLLFKNAKDAKECEYCIMELVNLASSAHSHVIDFSKGEDEMHSEDGVFKTTPANIEAALSTADNNIGLQLRDNKGKAVTPEPDPRRVIELSSSPGSVHNGHSRSNVERRVNTPAPIEQPDNANLKSGARKIPKIKKPGREINPIGDLHVAVSRHIDEFDFPEESPRMIRPSKVSKKGTLGALPKHAVGTPRASLHGVTRTKPIGPKPKPKPAQRIQVNDTSDEEDAISSQAIQPLPRARTNANNTVQPTQCPTQSADPEQQPEKSKARPRLSALPKIAKSMGIKASVNQLRLEADVFAIPQDEAHDEEAKDKSRENVKTKPKGRAALGDNLKRESLVHDTSKGKSSVGDESKVKPRARRRVAKDVNYKDTESSASDSSESDYVKARPKKPRSVAKAVSKPSESVPKKAAAAAKLLESKTRTGHNKATGWEADPRPISDQKHTVLSKLLSKPQITPQPESEEGKVVPNSASLTKKPLRQIIRKEPVEEDHEVTLLSSPDPVPEVQTAVPLQEVETRSQNSDQIFDEPVSFDDLPHDVAALVDRPASNLTPTESQVLQEVVTHVTSISQTMAVATSKRKRTREETPPSTPQKKRTKNEQSAGQSNAGQAENASFRPPTTMARPRVLSDPSSPLARPASKGIRDLKALQDENGSPNAESAIHHQETNFLASRKQVERRHTPLHQHAQRIYSGGSTNAEILSSNSKPIPASPHADSMAISGHVDRDRVDMEKELADIETARSDPFTQFKSPKLTAFTRRLTSDFTGVEAPGVPRPEVPFESSPLRPVAVEDLESPMNIRADGRALKIPKEFGAPKNSIRLKAPDRAKIDKIYAKASTAQAQELEPSLSRRHGVAFEDSVRNAPQQVVDDTPQEVDNYDDGSVYMEGDETLVALEVDSPNSLKTSPLAFRSSPPGNYAPSSHSSTSAESEPESNPLVPTPEAEEMEWEASLQPHQRSIHDQLIRISKHVVRHIVDKETAIDDIADIYAKDGQHLINALVERHSSEFESKLKDAERKKDNMRDEYSQLAKKMAKEREKYDPKTNVAAKG
ncbi:hypothetical protein K505DRAFT_362646 [Melanomma pulvis-pyrius CBS 109.77]|uniref:Uncharacterized protein n=1 Tax=Melanomma pulvis-pyrius CBS 109.77 TaxID=1314802 RepID=A0A6A6X8M2_9PLEO|nr:hypothetical protein K505DRAFT_362646 [Melanomma pulvis-pyrius CBS 109.77]